MLTQRFSSQCSRSCNNAIECRKVFVCCSSFEFQCLYIFISGTLHNTVSFSVPHDIHSSFCPSPTHQCHFKPLDRAGVKPTHYVRLKATSDRTNAKLNGHWKCQRVWPNPHTSYVKHKKCAVFDRSGHACSRRRNENVSCLKDIQWEAVLQAERPCWWSRSKEAAFKMVSANEKST